jgi:uncharacterized protein YbjT (DUF2867 family)
VILLSIYLLYALALTLALGRAGLRAGAPVPARAGQTAPRRILVVGATGGTGREIVVQALERGYEVTALARDPAKLGVEHPRLAVVRGDVLEPATLGPAVHGQDAVVCALGHKRWLGPSRILSVGTANLLRAMSAAGVPRLVCETSLGLGDSAGRMGLYYTLFVLPVILPFYYWDKTRQERAVSAAGAEWVIVRPGALTDRPARGRVRAGRDVGSFLVTVSVPRADVAAFLLDQLRSDEHLGTAVGVRT